MKQTVHQVSCQSLTNHGNFSARLYMCTSSKDHLEAGHLTGCGGVDPHNSLTSASSAFSEHFPHKTEKIA